LEKAETGRNGRLYALSFRRPDFWWSGKEQGGHRSHNEYRTVSAAVRIKLEALYTATHQDGIIVGISVFNL